jgi:hypothetical protein
MPDKSTESFLEEGQAVQKKAPQQNCTTAKCYNDA